jgi:smad nuclear-interacting protein 1
VLAESTNTVKGVVLKFTEPLDAAEPQDQWKIYPFKGDQSLGKVQKFKIVSIIEPVPLYGVRKTCYLFGRDNRVSDILLENPSCSM